MSSPFGESLNIGCGNIGYAQLNFPNDIDDDDGDDDDD